MYEQLQWRFGAGISSGNLHIWAQRARHYMQSYIRGCTDGSSAHKVCIMLLIRERWMWIMRKMVGLIYAIEVRAYSHQRVFWYKAASKFE